jgi:heterodisulfide reductase subunit A-like polyferredoxin
MPSSTVSDQSTRHVDLANCSSQQQPSQASNDVRLEVIVVGAGLAGLAAAISISLSGHSVTVLESAKELLEVYIPSIPHDSQDKG